MTGFKKLMRSGQIHMALAVGASIIILAFVSKRVLAVPMKPLWLSITSLIMVLYEAVVTKNKESKHLCRSIYWVSAVILVTVLIILKHLI